jgi:hypothetical protein
VSALVFATGYVGVFELSVRLNEPMASGGDELCKEAVMTGRRAGGMRRHDVERAVGQAQDGDVGRRFFRG